MLLMAEKGIRGKICHAMQKANNKYMKDYDKNKESSYLKYWNVNNLGLLKTTDHLPTDHRPPTTD